jgi:hypothetical protein
MFIIMTKKKKAKVAKVAKVKEVATSSAKPTSIRVGKVKQRIVEEENKTESEGENDEDSAQLSSLTPDGKNGDDEEGPVFENEQEELETFRSFKFPPGISSSSQTEG